MINIGNIEIKGLWVGSTKANSGFLGNVKAWGGEEPAPTADWLCFTAQDANSEVGMYKEGSPDDISLVTSTDGENWVDYNVGDPSIQLANIGDKVYFRAKTENQTISKNNSNYYHFSMSGRIAASGNIQTLLKADGTRIDAPANCYENMFLHCGSLTTAPELPATTLANYCYKEMFCYCSSLTTAPALPATTLASDCYGGMFSGCTSLTSAPELPGTTLAESCYNSMFDNCTSLTSAPALPATILANNCYANMFASCTSLTTAPALPATRLASYCYSYMFYNCTSLTTAPALPATTLARECYSNMFYNCSSLTTAPALPATILAARCYYSMFRGCSNLNTITLGYTGNFSSTYFRDWVSGVASSGTFYYNGSDKTRGTSAIPTGWTITPFTNGGI